MTPRIPASLPRVLLTAALSAGLVLGLAACGKKGPPKPVAGEEEAYTYPHAYPAPSTVTPGADSEEESGERNDPFWIFTTGDEKRTRTKTY
ncbi:hypothetical protein [Pelagibius marinus]|uniref:hypothetical protein n=1 Tax=Pelagibius marinus TaxID=2762760 RepID=UPI001873025D|nr:hypothetical protein [Pelagibius marinus]